ncbi:hypothetical protein BGX23_001372 [Mortierella sp. AD031]|nr:hypothetical protein BGX23_001372 [Mortierella sp. AD031]
MVVTINGEEEEIEVIGSGISGSTIQPTSERRPRPSLKLPNLKYNLSESSVSNYSPGTSVIFNAYRGHGRLLTQPYAASSDNDSDLPPAHAHQRIPGSQSQEWSEDPYKQHRHSQPLPPSHSSYDSDGYPPYHHQQQQHYPEYPPYRPPHTYQYHHHYPIQGTREIIENLVITRPRVRPKARMGENSTHPTAGLDLHRRG